jgi:hypothetical protein
MQELLRHSSLRSTLDVYTQAITPAKQAAQAAVMSLVFLPKQNRKLMLSPEAKNPATLYRAQSNRGAKGTHFCGSFAPQLNSAASK